MSRRLLICALFALASGLSDEDIIDTHPDGTPKNPQELLQYLSQNDAGLEEAFGARVRDAVLSGNLEAFTEAFQQSMASRIFAPDGSANNVARWRQSVREDEVYSGLLAENAPEFHQAVTDPAVSDDQVQSLLRRFQQQAVENAQKGEL